jgi:triosephosphate isomerase
MAGVPMPPVVIVNCKTYPEATGENAVRLAKVCDELARRYHADVRICVQATDLAIVAKAVRIPVYAQHVDPVESGKSTGWVTARAVRLAGGKGSLLNHAEHRMTTREILHAAELLRKEGLEVVVCAENVQRLKELDAQLQPTFFAVEPPELIGGDVSVALAQPSVVLGAVRATRTPLLIGAGVKDNRDLTLASLMGASGVLLSSGIVTARDQRQALIALLMSP